MWTNFPSAGSSEEVASSVKKVEAKDKSEALPAPSESFDFVKFLVACYCGRAAGDSR